MPRLAAALLVLPVLAGLAPPLPAQDLGVPLAQVERKYRRMNEVHILKCDHDGTGYFNRAEMMCVQGIYQQFYVNND